MSDIDISPEAVNLTGVKLNSIGLEYEASMLCTLSTDLAAARAERDEAWEAWRNESRAATLWTARAATAEAQRDALQRRVDEAARIIGWLLTFARDIGLVGTTFRGRMVRRTEAYIAADAFLSARKDPTHE